MGAGDHRCTLGTTATSSASEKSQAGDDRGIPPFKKRRVGHPALFGFRSQGGMAQARKRVSHSCAFVAQGWDSTAACSVGFFPKARVGTDAFVRPAGQSPALFQPNLRRCPRPTAKRAVEPDAPSLLAHPRTEPHPSRVRIPHLEPRKRGATLRCGRPCPFQNVHRSIQSARLQGRGIGHD